MGWSAWQDGDVHDDEIGVSSTQAVAEAISAIIKRAPVPDTGPLTPVSSVDVGEAAVAILQPAIASGTYYSSGDGTFVADVLNAGFATNTIGIQFDKLGARGDGSLGGDPIDQYFGEWDAVVNVVQNRLQWGTDNAAVDPPVGLALLVEGVDWITDPVHAPAGYELEDPRSVVTWLDLTINLTASYLPSFGSLSTFTYSDPSLEPTSFSVDAVLDLYLIPSDVDTGTTWNPVDTAAWSGDVTVTIDVVAETASITASISLPLSTAFPSSDGDPLGNVYGSLVFQPRVAISGGGDEFFIDIPDIPQGIGDSGFEAVSYAASVDTSLTAGVDPTNAMVHKVEPRWRYWIPEDEPPPGVIPPLRLKQRNDGLGLTGHARLSLVNQGSSQQSNSVRATNKNRYL